MSKRCRAIGKTGKDRGNWRNWRPLPNYTMVDKLHHLACMIWPMALNIKNAEVERLATEIAHITGETKTEAIRKALVERKGQLRTHICEEDRRVRLLRFLERDVWPRVPRRVLGRRLTKKQREEILGYGSQGV
jgi:antitoxin VapB